MVKLKTVVYNGPFDEVEIRADLTIYVCPRGGSVDVPAVLAKSLLAQKGTWSEPNIKTGTDK